MKFAKPQAPLLLNLWDVNKSSLQPCASNCYNDNIHPELTLPKLTSGLRVIVSSSGHCTQKMLKVCLM